MPIKALIFSLAVAIVIAIGWYSGAAEARSISGCGSGTECYSVPSGCGIGVGCVRVKCNSFSCPVPDWEATDEYCFYCQDSDPGEG